ncbi:MAG: glycosyltransferase [Rhodospirillales bacterium]|nr:glycosyltransferase [Rhodospirillales bacterium]
MRLAVIVSEFPKTSETFVLRDLLAFHDLGAELRLYHLAPYRHSETLHDFARPVLDWVHRQGMFDARAWAALTRAVRRRPTVMGGVSKTLATGFASEPELLAKSLALLPKVAALAEDAEGWRAEHIHAEFAGHPATAAWIIGRLTGIPYSVSCRAHDIFASQALLDRKLGEAAFVRTNCQHNKDFLLRHVPELVAESIEVIHSGMDLRDLSPLPPRNPDGTFRVLFVGRLAPQKGVDVLLRAFAAGSSAWHLDIIGDGPERGRLEGLARQLGLTGRVRWHGALRFEDVVPAYANADAVVAPSIIGPGNRTEGIPNVLMEALACNRPVVASAVSGIPELVIDGHTGLLVPPGEAGAVAAALRRIQADPDHAFAMAAAGRRRVEAEFDLASTTARQFAAFSAHRGPPSLKPPGAADESLRSEIPRRRRRLDTHSPPV